MLIATLQIGMNGYTPETAPAFYRELRPRLAALPGVEEAALASWFPLGLAGCKGSGRRVEGYVPPARTRTLTYEFAIVSPRYFAATAHRRSSRAATSTTRDDLASERVAIVNQAFATRFWPGQDPLGRRFRTRRAVAAIVGVTRTGKYNRLDEGQWPFYYLPDQQGVPDLDLSAGRPHEAATPPRSRGRCAAPCAASTPASTLLRTVPLRDHVEGVFFPQRMASTLLVLLGRRRAAARGAWASTA